MKPGSSCPIWNMDGKDSLHYSSSASNILPLQSSSQYLKHSFEVPFGFFRGLDRFFSFGFWLLTVFCFLFSSSAKTFSSSWAKNSKSKGRFSSIRLKQRNRKDFKVGDLSKFLLCKMLSDTCCDIKKQRLYKFKQRHAF